MTLCVKQDVKDFLKMATAENDDQIDKLIPAAQGFIESYCRRDFELSSVPSVITEYHEGGSDRIFLKQFPVDSTYGIKVYEDWTRVFASDTEVLAEDFYIDYENGIIFADYDLEKGWGSVKVVYKPQATPAGQQPTGEIAIAKQACIEIVARKLKLGSSGDIGIMSRTSGGGSSVTYSMEDILPETKALLDSISKPL